MKSLLGFKTKASQAVKDRLDQAKARVNSAGTAAVQKPFDNGRKEDASKHAYSQEQDPASDVEHSSPLKGDGAKSIKQRTRSASPSQGLPTESQGMTEGDPVIEHLLQNARSEAVRAQFRCLPAEEYTATHALKLLAGTYNVNGRIPPAGLDLKPWLDISSTQPDIVAVAFQEIVPLSAQNVVMGASLEAAGAWDKLIDAVLNGPSEHEGGHLVIRAPAWSKGQHLQSGKATEQPTASENDGKDLASEPQTAREENGSLERLHVGSSTELDELEGYLSPAEETFSIFSDEHTGPKPYVQMAGKQMVGIYVSVWVRRALLKHVRGVQVTSIGTGIMGYLGNKGAVAARLRIFDSGLTIIAAHLSSGEQEGDELKRNYDYSEIVRRGSFPPDTPFMEPENVVANVPAHQSDSKVAGAGSMSGQWGHLSGLLDTEHVIWMGDLNYRLTMPDAEARAAIKAGKLAEVAEWDELVNMVRQKRAFQGWQEGELSFPPTFKFKRGTNMYLGDSDDEKDPTIDLSTASVTSTTHSISSTSPTPQVSGGKSEGVEKHRTPAWTDRILWRPHSGLQQLTYTSAPLTLSDHKPVVTTFDLVAREYMRDKVEAAVDTARRIVDAREMAAMPRCELEPLAVDTGVVYYAREKVAQLILSNTGVVKARWQFMSLPGIMFGDAGDKASRTAPRWARVQPSQGSLEPGEATEILLKLWVDGGKDSTAELLATAADMKLDAILVLRVEDGNDIFCSVTGSYAPSFFGLPLALLASLPRPLVLTEGWETGSPRLRINTQKRARQRDQHGSEGPPADFYSPVSSFHESPHSVAASSEADFAAARAHHRASSRSSIGSDAEFEQLASSRGLPEIVTSASSPPQHMAPLPKNTGLSSVEEVTEAFSSAFPSRNTDLHSENAERIASGAAAGSCHSALHDSASVTKLLPPELASLTAFLYEQGRLRTPGLFINSVDLAHAVSPRSPASLPQKEGARTVTAVRESLDRGQAVPEGASAQDVAATILAFFCALPTPFMPHAAAQVCNVCSPSRPAAASLLADALSPVEWAIFRHTTGLIRDVLHPSNAGENGLTKAALANLFAEVWFERMPPGLGAAGQELRPQDISDLQRLAEGVTEVAERRSAFVAAFFDPDD